MDILQLLHTLLTIIAIVCSWYFRREEKRQAQVLEVNEVYGVLTNQSMNYVTQAEKAYEGIPKSGILKLQWCVDRLYRLIPASLQKVITPADLERIVQCAFEEMEQYANTQLDQMEKKHKLFQ